MPRKLTGPPASHGSRPEARIAQRISSSSRRPVRSTIARPVGVGGGAVQVDPAGQDRVEPQRALVRPHVVDHVVHVERGTAAQRPHGADEAGIAEPVLVERGQVGGLAGEQERGVERAGGGAVHLVERVAQAELLDRRGHPGRHDAPHPAALDHERDAAPVGPGPRARTLGAPAQERLHDPVIAQVFGDELGRPKRVR